MHAQLPEAQCHPEAHPGSTVAQLVPQLPQFFTSVKMFVSQPFPAMPSQSAVPPLQARPHVPAMQAGVTPDGAVQAFLQLPQLLTSVLVLVSQPVE